MRLLTVALILWPSLAYAQFGNSPTNSDEFTSQNRLGKLAKKISDEKSSTTNPPPTQAQILAPSGLQNSGLASPISNPTSSLSSKSVTAGAYDLSAGQDISLDIAGITIGMSPDQVKQTLTSKGYILEETIKAPSFEELVTIKRDDIPRSGQYSFKGAIKGLVFKKGVFEVIRVNFLSMPGHPIARSVSYSNGDTSLTFEKMRHLLGDKYGDDKTARETKKRHPAGAAPFHDVTTGKYHDIRKLKLEAQNRFEWYNRSEWYKGDRRYRNSQNLQRVTGTIQRDEKRSIHEKAMIKLNLEGERSLNALQETQIRKQFGAVKTTF